MKGKAILTFVRIAPRKARLVADLIREKPVDHALGLLKYTPKRGAGIIEKILKSAIANAEQNPAVVSVDNLYVSSILINPGPTMKRFRPCSMGRANKIRKRSSHIIIELDEALAK
ncbi:MAG: 50S ribosomal protein L22 [Candidatus Schekmanbacteria bacterium]|nr:50S ribosomal protein L22 [Candidatus Schekmanbacteria bacterium]